MIYISPLLPLSESRESARRYVEMRRKHVIASLLAALIAIQAAILPIYAGGNNNPNKVHGSPAYVLNILGKKVDWKGNGDYDNPDRHTMFIPEETPGYNITMTITSGSEFAVLDGNAFDDNETALQLKQGRYYIYVVALAKPGGSAKIWAKAGLTLDGDGNLLIPLMLDTLRVKRMKGQPYWENATEMFYVSWEDVVDIVFPEGYTPTPEELQALADALGVSIGQPVWIFDFLGYMSGLDGFDDGFYFWKINNQGCKHLQVRLYSK